MTKDFKAALENLFKTIYEFVMGILAVEFPELDKIVNGDAK